MRGQIIKSSKVAQQRLQSRVPAEILRKSFFSEVAELFERYMLFLRTDNGKLLKFWVSYLDLVDILQALIRALREGDWGLHLSSIRKLVPLVLCLSLCQLCEMPPD